jgi:hypothetical protein
MSVNSSCVGDRWDLRWGQNGIQTHRPICPGSASVRFGAEGVVNVSTVSAATSSNIRYVALFFTQRHWSLSAATTVRDGRRLLEARRLRIRQLLRRPAIPRAIFVNVVGARVPPIPQCWHELEFKGVGSGAPGTICAGRARIPLMPVVAGGADRPRTPTRCAILLDCGFEAAADGSCLTIVVMAVSYTKTPIIRRLARRRLGAARPVPNFWNPR